jgi:hypothetical protein
MAWGSIMAIFKGAVIARVLKIINIAHAKIKTLKNTLLFFIFISPFNLFFTFYKS